MAKTSPKATLLPDTAGPRAAGPVECLGLTFESDDARRAHFLARLKEQLPELRKRHDFPIAIPPPANPLVYHQQPSAQRPRTTRLLTPNWSFD